MSKLFLSIGKPQRPVHAPAITATQKLNVLWTSGAIDDDAMTIMA